MKNIVELKAFRASAHHDEPLPLLRDVGKATEYPLDALPVEIKKAALAIHERTRAPLALCAVSAVAAVNLAIQGQIDTVSLSEKQIPTSLFFASIAESSDRKSSADSLAQKPIDEKEKELRDDYVARKGLFDSELEIWETNRKSAISGFAPGGSVAAIHASLGPKPIEPAFPALKVADATIEGFTKMLAGGATSVGLFTDEAAQFFGGYSMANENRARAGANYCQLWDGSAIKSLRSTTDFQAIYGKRVCANLLMQPNIAEKLYADDLLIQQGFTSRFLPCAPNSLAGQRFYKAPSLQADIDLNIFHKRTKALLDMTLPYSGADRRELAPRLVRPSATGHLRLVEFHDEVERELAPGGKYHDIKSLAGKMPEHVVRLAANLNFYVDNAMAEIESGFIESAIEIIRYHAQEALRLFGFSQANGEIRKAQRLLDWLKTSLTQAEFYPTQIYKNGVAGAREKKDVDLLLKILIHHGYVEPVDPMVIDGTRRKEVYRFIPYETPETY